MLSNDVNDSLLLVIDIDQITDKFNIYYLLTSYKKLSLYNVRSVAALLVLLQVTRTFCSYSLQQSCCHHLH